MVAIDPHPTSVSTPTSTAPATVSLTREALERLVDRVYRLGRISGIRDVCEALDELLPTDEPGDTVILLAPWLAANGIQEDEVAA